MADIYRSDIVPVDLNHALSRKHVGSVLATGDNGANRFGASVLRDGKVVDLTGCGVTAYFMRPGQNALTLKGQTDGHVAYVDLKQACYTFPSSFTLTIKVSGNGITSALRIIDGYILLTQTDELDAPTGTVPTLDDIFAQIAAMETATASANEAAALALAAKDNANGAAVNAVNIATEKGDEAIQLAQQEADKQNGAIATLTEEIENRLKDVQDAFALEVNSGYITPGGTTGANANYIYSALMETKPGEMWLYEGKNNSGGLSVVWGYSSPELENPTALVPAGTIDGYAIVEVPEGIYYIRAQALSKANTSRVARLLHGKNVFFYDATMGSIREFFTERIVNPRQSNQYKVYVLPSVYNFDDEFTEDEKAASGFIGVTVPEWTTIEGYTRAAATVFSCTLSSNSISTLNLSCGSSLKNVTVLGENCRYAIHDDFGMNGDESIRYMSDCIVQATNCSYGYAYGGGCRSGQQFFFERCVFRATNYDGGGFLMHSNTGFTAPALVVMNNCEMYSENGHPERACNFRGLGTTSVINKAILNNCKCDGFFLEKSTVFDWDITGGGNSVCPTATSSDCKFNFADAPYTDTTYTVNYFNALDVGSFRFADGIPQWWDGTKWVKADGSAV